MMTMMPTTDEKDRDFPSTNAAPQPVFKPSQHRSFKKGMWTDTQKKKGNMTGKQRRYVKMLIELCYLKYPDKLVTASFAFHDLYRYGNDELGTRTLLQLHSEV
jgi:hypothetical protein